MSRLATGATACAIAATAALALAGCSSSGDGASADARPELKVTESFMPEPVGGSGMAAGFVTVTNSGSTADRLTSVTSTLSDDITLHTTKDQQMREVKSLPVPAHGELDLERGGNHLMFMHLKKQPERGEKVAVELHFEKGGVLKAELPVKEPTYQPEHK
ncbi:copper chaperone PCu(A)C [Streptomyces sp. NBC_01387]|uniref:copper chaperone PCu(A)C n=1 Tax=unclassified Streptomyces TaxID=2593676 RepID=UPI002025714B|nr:MULTISPECIES: copper chaperone PCu(A)C [unclassified Streptomyces]MCX4549477.1 copper chaperone PCu(A)C [Streptomyces sp. NBC_01500]WSC21014.1 copper chaperone PCu(A)C [Streptomyces sp. NBC_01766]WSV55000.1 copper chaperone PCu(A)C [Streptomyces sp. NBC_01014]